MKNSFLILLLLPLFIPSCNKGPKQGMMKDDLPTDEAQHEVITLGGGCYWCVEAVFQQLEGVISSTSGFMGGHIPDPSYDEVTAGFSGHIEVIQIVYDPEIISTSQLLDWFWKAHDPTNPRGQGADIGERYTSHIFTHSEEQHNIATASKKTAQADFKKTITTKIKEASVFYKAKEEHQDYYFRNKGKNPYCPAVIKPKLRKLKLEY